MICGIRKWFIVVGLGWVLAGGQLVAFDPGVGPGNIDATDKIAYVSQQYTFSDGNYARGMVWFKQGFVVPANCKVMLDVNPAVEFVSWIDIDVTATLLLKSPLRLEAGYINSLAGTLKKYPGSFFEPMIIFSSTDYHSSISINDHLYLPDGATFDLNGRRLSLLGYFGSYFYDRPRVPKIFLGQTLTLQNGLFLLSDAPTSTWPIWHFTGEPLIDTRGAFKGFILQNAGLEIFEQATLDNINFVVTGKSFVRNGALGKPQSFAGSQQLPYQTSAGFASSPRATLKRLVSNPPEFLTTTAINMLPPAQLMVGPDVDLVLGNLGLRQVTASYGKYEFAYAYGSIQPFSADPLAGNDNELYFLDSSLTISRPCTIEGGVRVVLDGQCDFYSVSATPTERVLTLGGHAPDAGFPVDAFFDIRPGAQLNVHDMVLLNANTIYAQ